jgi:hypothetical protein
MLLAASAVSRSTLRRLALTALAAATLGLSACGGGDRSVEYKPTAMLVFGDEHSDLTDLTVGTSSPQTVRGVTWAVDGVVGTSSRVCLTSSACTADGDVVPNVVFAETTPPTRRYQSLNDANSPRSVVLIEDGTASSSTNSGVPAGTPLQRRTVLTYLCSGNNWVQRVANSFGLGFSTVNGCASDGTGAQSFADPGNKVADVISDLRAQRGQMREGVLVTVMVGQHDIIEQYELVKAAGFTNAAIQSAEGILADRGRALASEIRSVTDTGAKVILVKTPNLSRSPFAGTEGRGSVLNDLSEALNQAVYVNPEISRLGRKVAGVDTNDVTLLNTTTTGYTNDAAACDPALLVDPAANTLVTDIDDMPRVCNTFTLKSGINSTAYVWATPRHLGPGAHSFIGSVAFNRAANQF